MLPALLGVIDQLTAVLLAPVTVALNCWLCPDVSVTEGGFTDTVIVGISVTVAVADLFESATLVAVTVTNCWLEILAGAV